MSLMEVQKIERYVEDLLTVSGFRRDGAEQHLWLLLHHLYSAVAMYELMSAEDKVIIADTQKKLRYFFDSKCDLKERKRTKKEKEGMPPHPHAKEKENKKEKDEKTHTHLTRVADLDLEERRKRFLAECQSFGNQYDHKEINKFFTYWSMKGRKGGKMRFEREAYWDTAGCMERWMNNRYAAYDENATLQLEKTKEKTLKAKTVAEQQQTVAAIREQADARREQEQEHSKENQMLTDEYLAKNPDGILARIAREKRRLTPDPSPKGEGSK